MSSRRLVGPIRSRKLVGNSPHLLAMTLFSWNDFIDGRPTPVVFKNEVNPAENSMDLSCFSEVRK